MKWQLVFTKQAQKDSKKSAAAGFRENAERLLDVLRKNPFQVPPLIHITNSRLILNHSDDLIIC